MASCDSYNFLKYLLRRKPGIQSGLSASKDTTTRPIGRERMVPHSSQRSTAGEGGLRVTATKQGGCPPILLPGTPPLATLGGWDGWMLLPDWDYGDPSCSLKTSGVGVVLIVAYSTAAPGLCSSAFQLHIRSCPRTVITWEADGQSAVTPAAVVYDVTAHSFPLRQSVCLWLFHGRS